MGLDLPFRISINPLFPGEKIIQGDQRHARYHGAFRPETHTPESFLASIEEGKAFCAELSPGECGLEHHGQWCCKERREQGDHTHCGRPEGHRIGWPTHARGFPHATATSRTCCLAIVELLAESQRSRALFLRVSHAPEIWPSCC